MSVLQTALARLHAEIASSPDGTFREDLLAGLESRHRAEFEKFAAAYRPWETFVELVNTAFDACKHPDRFAHQLVRTCREKKWGHVGAADDLLAPARMAAICEIVDELAAARADYRVASGEWDRRDKAIWMIERARELVKTAETERLARAFDWLLSERNESARGRKAVAVAVSLLGAPGLPDGRGGRCATQTDAALAYGFTPRSLRRYLGKLSAGEADDGGELSADEADL